MDIASPVTIAQLKHSRLFSEELGIALHNKSDEEYFKWFLASLLFGGHISTTIATHTYQAFSHHGLLTPEAIIAAGQAFLINPIMRDGGYVRYDGRKSEQVLRDCETLLSEYQGSLKRLHHTASDSSDLEARLDAFYGIGPITVNIFLRELRPYWAKADPSPLPRVVEAATKWGIDLQVLNRKSISFTRVEAGLVRLITEDHSH